MDIEAEAAINELELKLNYWLKTKQCDHASVRRALCLPATGDPIVTRIRRAYWVGTVTNEYCLLLGYRLDDCLAALRRLGIT